MKVSELEGALAQVASLQAAAAEFSKASEARVSRARAEAAEQVCAPLHVSFVAKKSHPFAAWRPHAAWPRLA